MARNNKLIKLREEDEGASITDENYLKILGERVRNARARHGMTRRMLAHDSEISERYLAELESGRGNLSILLLRRLALAIDVSLGELIDEGPPLSVEYTMLTERLRYLGPKELKDASSLIARRFGALDGKRERVALIGLRGSGKTTLGVLLARHLGWPFIELSGEIEAEAGVGVNEIFEFWGQAGYRRYERRALEKILRTRSNFVLATSGGLVSEAATFERLLDSCYTVWLHASPREHWGRVIHQGDFRVRVGTREAEALADMRRILSQREALYHMADARLSTSGKSPEKLLPGLASLIKQKR
ncbi:MAG: helix-turn-helix transcriptional regulator [Candidatus Binataceae bacterium]